MSRIERGGAEAFTVRTLKRVVGGLGARVTVRIWSQGEDVDRLLDAGHAALVEHVMGLLRSHGWETVPEATFSRYGERGSIDILAFHRATGSLLVVEVKSVVPDVQATLAGVDRKARIAIEVARERGWRVRTVSKLLVLPDDRTARRRIAVHGETFLSALPARTVQMRRWIRSPAGSAAGLMFVSIMGAVNARHRIGRRRPTPARDAKRPTGVSRRAVGEAR